MLQLKSNITKKVDVEKKIKLIDFDVNNNESGKYKVEVICKSAVYIKESNSGYLPEMYYLVFLTLYLEKKNI